MEENSKREIVCNFEGRRRPDVFSACGDAKEEYENLLAAVKVTFADLLSEENQSNYSLQVDNHRHGLIDLVNVHVSDDEKLFLRLWKPDHRNDEVGEGDKFILYST